MVWTDEDSYINQLSYERKEIVISQHRFFVQFVFMNRTLFEI